MREADENFSGLTEKNSYDYIYELQALLEVPSYWIIKAWEPIPTILLSDIYQCIN